MYCKWVLLQIYEVFYELNHVDSQPRFFKSKKYIYMV